MNKKFLRHIVIVCTYNHGKWIERCICIRNQENINNNELNNYC